MSVRLTTVTCTDLIRHGVHQPTADTICTGRNETVQSAHAIAGVGIVACSHPTRHQPGAASCDLRADGSRRVEVGGSVQR